MLIVIDMPDKYKDNYKTVYNGSKKADEILNAIKNGTVLPKGMTNGDMIKMLFSKDIADVIKNRMIGDWWNEPYKEVENEK